MTLNFEVVKTTIEVMTTATALVATGWGSLRLFHRYYERDLFFSGCHILTLSLWEDLKNGHLFILKLRKRKWKEGSHAFMPLIVLPHRYKNHFNIRNGARVILRFNPPGDEELTVMAYAFWFPKCMDHWDNFDQPAVSLVLRRYFSIERPVLGKGDKLPSEWRKISHGRERNGREELKIYNRVSQDKGHLIWAVSNKYCARFWNPGDNYKGAVYRDKWKDGWFLEYSGFSLQVSKRSLFSITKDS